MIIAGVEMKNDHRVTVTKKMITESFLELIKEKPLAAITVKELCEKAHINRATFYAHLLSEPGKGSLKRSKPKSAGLSP